MVFIDKRTLIFLLILLLLSTALGGCTPPSEKENDAPVSETFSVADALSSVLAVTCRYTDGSGKVFATSGGSGVICRMDENGGAYVLTNYHVIHDVYRKGEDGVCADLSVAPYGLEQTDGLKATCVGFVGDFDLAVLYVPSLTDLLPSAKAAKESRAPVLGERVLAVGNALSRGIAVTEGIISRESEELSILVPYRTTSISLRVLRHDAAVNEGNSGGALFSADGKLLGLVNARLSGEGTVGINYAIPASVALALAEDVIRSGHADTWQFGALLKQEIKKTVIADDRVKVETQITVDHVDEGTPASTFLMRGDVLLEVAVNGVAVQITSDFALSELFLALHAEDVLVFRYSRGEKEQVHTLQASALQFVEVS